MTTLAGPAEDGAACLMNGKNLWVSHGPVPTFVVEGDSPGLSVEHRCVFLGLKGLQDGRQKFENIRVPAENVM